MVVQAWNNYGVDVPIINHFFGIKPMAYKKSIYVSPQMPLRWADASLENVRIGNNSFSIGISRKNDHKEYHINQTLADWTVMVDVKNARKILVNNIETDLKTISGDMIKLLGKEFVVQIY